ncbi:MAG TPA: hypothetical protein VGR02_14505 [Thermoanaerobaculia bacterium]|nr:hypothetical protein [Thermoanaerobaculia bacterium]
MDEQPVQARGARAILILGIIGLPILIAGMLALDARLCVTGAVITATAVLLHVLLGLR